MKVTVEFVPGKDTYIYNGTWVPVYPHYDQQLFETLRERYDFDAVGVEPIHWVFRVAKKAAEELGGRILKIIDEGEPMVEDLEKTII